MGKIKITSRIKRNGRAEVKISSGSKTIHKSVKIK